MRPLNEFEQTIDLEKIEDSDYLLDILIQMENVLDSLDVYVYRNWFEGQVIEGPIVRRHWLTFSLLYPHDKMPDPRAALRLLKHGIQVEFSQMKQVKAGDVTHPDYEPSHASDWLVTITIPRRLLDQTEEADLESYDDEVNPEDVTAAKDTGLDNETSFQQDEQSPDGMEQTNPSPNMPSQPVPMQNQPPPR